MVLWLLSVVTVCLAVGTLLALAVGLSRPRRPAIVALGLVAAACAVGVVVVAARREADPYRGPAACGLVDNNRVLDVASDLGRPLARGGFAGRVTIEREARRRIGRGTVIRVRGSSCIWYFQRQDGNGLLVRVLDISVTNLRWMRPLAARPEPFSEEIDGVAERVQLDAKGWFTSSRGFDASQRHNCVLRADVGVRTLVVQISNAADRSTCHVAETLLGDAAGALAVQESATDPDTRAASITGDLGMHGILRAAF